MSVLSQRFIAEIAKMGPTVGDVHIPVVEQDENAVHSIDCQCEICRAKQNTEYLPSNSVIAKADFFSTIPERRLAYAIAYPVYPEHTYDSQGDRAQPAEIEKMAHDFMIRSQRFDFQHIADIPKGAAYVVESYIAPVDFSMTLGNGISKEIRKGSWVVATYFADESLWELVKAGKINAYSIFGKGKRIKVEE